MERWVLWHPRGCGVWWGDQGLSEVRPKPARLEFQLRPLKYKVGSVTRHRVVVEAKLNEAKCKKPLVCVLTC